MSAPLTNLINLLRQDKVIPVIGAGFSNAVAELPGWRGAIENGLNYAAARHLDHQQIAHARLLLGQGELTGAAVLLKQLLQAHGYPFADWVAGLFHNPVIKYPELLHSLAYLCAPIILTTNYDNLLSATKLLGQRQVYTWRDYQSLQQALRDKTDVIVHLHGTAERPDTVVLSTDDYTALNKELGYKSVLQQLWSSYHFLFIGCSSDGMQDDDFSTIIHFLGQWFPLSRHQHYALVHQSAIDQNAHLPLLYKCNIEAISLGADYASLPEFINQFNPNKERYRQAVDADLADLRRAAADLHRLLLADGEAATREHLTSWLHSVLPGGAYWIASPQLTAMEQALQEVNRTLAGNKQKLVFYQEIIQGLIQHSEVSAAVANWQANRANPAALNNAGFINAALVCYACLQRLPIELLEEVAYRAPHAIHPYFFNGYLGSFIREYHHACRIAGDRLESWFNDDPYFFENLSRILASLENVLELDADHLFGQVGPALPTHHLPDAFLVLLTRTAVSVRTRQFPHAELARLDAEANLPFRGVFPGFHQGKRCLVGFTARRAFYWNPAQDLLPHYFFEVKSGRSIQQLVLQSAAPEYHFTIIADGRLYTFQDFTLTSQVKMEMKLQDVVYLPHMSCFYGLREENNRLRGPALLRLAPDGSVQSLFRAEDAWRLARTSPYLQHALQTLDESEEAHHDYPFLFNGQLHVLRWQQEQLLCFRAKLDIDSYQATLLVIGQPTVTGLVPRCTIVVPRKLSIAFDLNSDAQGVSLLLGYLATKSSSHCLLQVVEGLENTSLLEVGEDNSFFPTDTSQGLRLAYDVKDLCWSTPTEAFGIQGDKYLLLIKPAERDCRQLEVSDLRQILIVD